MAPHNLTEIEDKLVFNFNGDDFQGMNLTILNTLSDFFYVLQLISIITGEDIEIYVESYEDGSWNGIIKASKKCLSIFTVILAIYDSSVKEKYKITEDTTRHTSIVNVAEDEYSIPYVQRDIFESIKKNWAIRNHCSRAFKIMSEDSRIDSFGISKIEGGENFISIKNSEFSRLSENFIGLDLSGYDNISEHIPHPEKLFGPNDSDDEKTGVAELTIIRAIFERTTRSWQFSVNDDFKFDAPILDDLFFNCI